MPYLCVFQLTGMGQSDIEVARWHFTSVVLPLGGIWEGGGERGFSVPGKAHCTQKLGMHDSPSSNSSPTRAPPLLGSLLGPSTFQEEWVCIIIFFLWQGLIHNIWMFPGEGSNQSCSCRPLPQPQSHQIGAAAATYTTA